MIQQLVTYQGAGADRFDRDYYENHHIPLALEIGRPYGLLSMQVLYPSTTDGDLVAVAVMTFTNEESARALFAAPRFHELVEDLPRYTEIRPEQNMITFWQGNSIA